MSRATDITALIDGYQRRLQFLRMRVAQEGRTVDPSVLMEIEDIEAKIAELRTELDNIKTGTPPETRVPPLDPTAFDYDAYISYVDQGEDAVWVWDRIVPRLTAANLRVAVSGEIDHLGVARVENIEQGITRSKRTVTVLSEAYLSSTWANFINTLAQTLGLQEGTYRLLPVRIAPIAESHLPVRLSMLTTLDLADPRRAEAAFQRLIRALQDPLPPILSRGR